MSTKPTPTALALEALRKIEKHEKECGRRWAEATVELKYIKRQMERQSVRWEKVAWLLISTVGLTIIGYIITLIT